MGLYMRDDFLACYGDGCGPAVVFFNLPVYFLSFRNGLGDKMGSCCFPCLWVDVNCFDMGQAVANDNWCK